VRRALARRHEIDVSGRRVVGDVQEATRRVTERMAISNSRCDAWRGKT